MKIAEVVAVFPPYFAGMGNACLRYSEELVKLGHDVEVYTSNYPHTPYSYPDGLTVHRLQHQFKYGNAPLLLGLFRIKAVDLIHLHYPFYFGAEITYIVSKLRKIPYVVTYHMDIKGTGFLRHMFRLHKKLLFRTIMNGARQIYVGSSDFGLHSDLAYIKSIRDRIIEIPFGVDVERFKPLPPSLEIRTTLGLSPNDRVVMFIGQLDRPHYSKGIPVLLEAFSQIRQPGVKLVIVGGGDLQPSYAIQAHRLGIQDDVLFAGSVDNDHLNEYISIATFTVLPSLEESFGMVLLESQSAGKCVIATNLPGVRAVVEENRDGLLVEPNNAKALGDKIKKLLAEPELVQLFGENGRRKVESRYTWRTTTGLLAANFMTVVDKGL